MLVCVTSGHLSLCQWSSYMDLTTQWVQEPASCSCQLSLCIALLGMGNGQLWLHSHQCLWSFESGESHQTKAICRGWVQYGGLCPNPPLVSTHICFPSSCFFYKSKGRYFWVTPGLCLLFTIVLPCSLATLFSLQPHTFGFISVYGNAEMGCVALIRHLPSLVFFP
jgi:hypothetical protein